MNKLSYFFVLFFIVSCGGGGGGSSAPPAAFAINLSSSSSISIDEDSIYTGNVVATANQPVTLQYALTSTTSYGTLSFSGTGAITYTPNNNYNGQDEFSYSVTAVEKSVTRNSTVTITINPVNDAPFLTITSKDSLDENNVLFDQSPSLSITYSDIDNTNDELTFTAKVNNNFVPSTFTETSEGIGNIVLDLSSLSSAGFFDAEIIVSDGDLTGSDSYSTWHISNKTVVTINQDDDPEDGFDGGSKTPKDYYVYYLVGDPSSRGRTKYLFIGDSLNSESDINLYRRALIASVNKLNSSDAAEFFSDDYFTVVSAEPVNPDGTSPVGIRTGCYDFDEDIYCIGEMDTAIFDVLLPDNILVSTLTRVQGRGVNLGNRNIQRILESDPERTRHTLMHELGHAHGFMGDEYRSDERDLTDSGRNVNTTIESNVSILKWNHHIPDQLNVLGKDIQVCYNYGDGSIADRDDLGITPADCDCNINEWRLVIDANGNESYDFVRKNPECSGVGLFEGNYYGLYDNYRPTFCSVMDSCTSAGYGPVNIEGFAVGSIQNQGFYRTDSAGFSRDETTNNANGWRMVLDVEYDTSKITLKWYVNGVEDTSKQNQTTVTFERPADNGVEIYTAKAVDLTGTIQASDDVLNNSDFYEGAFQSYFYWCEYDANDDCLYSYGPDPSTYSRYDFGFMYGPLGVTWGINWEKW